jgi:tetratricopeptide (TPR) repeat protein
LAYCEEGKFGEAEKALRKGLQLSPGDKSLSVALAQTLDRASKAKEAVSAYCEAAFIAKADDPPQADALLSRALELAPEDEQVVILKTSLARSQGDEDSAIALLDRILKRNPRHGTALGLKAQMLYDRGDREGAIRLFRMIDVQSPELSWVLVYLARALHDHYGQDGDAEALDLLDRVTQLSPQDLDAQLLRAEILQTTDIGKALDLLRGLAQQDRRSAEIQFALAQALISVADYDGASVALDVVLDIDQKSVPALIAKAQVLEQQGRLDDASVVLDAALDIDRKSVPSLIAKAQVRRRAVRAQPGDANVLRLLLNTLLEQGLCDEALEEVTREINRDPNYWEAYFLRGQILWLRNRLDETLESFQRAIEIYPDKPYLQAYLGDVLRCLNRYDEAGVAFDRALDLDPNSSQVIGYKAYYLCEAAAYNEAAELLKRAIAVSPEQAWFHSLLGWALEHLDRSTAAEAEQAFARASELEPENPFHRKGLANMIYDSGRREQAEAMLEEIIKQQVIPSGGGVEASLISLLGWCHYRLRRYDEAVRLFQSSLSIDDNDIRAQFALALALLESGRGRANDEYEEGVKRAKSKHVLRQRGLFYVALYDLVNAAADARVKEEQGCSIFARLRSELANSGIDVAKLSWLGDRLPAGAERS